MKGGFANSIEPQYQQFAYTSQCYLLGAGWSLVRDPQEPLSYLAPIGWQCLERGGRHAQRHGCPRLGQVLAMGDPHNFARIIRMVCMPI